MMNQKGSFWKGFTIQVYVSEIKKARPWYERLIGRKPDSAPFPEFLEWEIVPDFWFQIVEKKGMKVPKQNRRMRLGVRDIGKERARVAEGMSVKVTKVEGLAGVVKWCNFEDPWGNKLGLFQDMERFP
jgi:predicted enzyme related to lactoylglutathione lyase